MRFLSELKAIIDEDEPNPCVGSKRRRNTSDFCINFHHLFLSFLFNLLFFLITSHANLLYSNINLSISLASHLFLISLHVKLFSPALFFSLSLTLSLSLALLPFLVDSLSTVCLFFLSFFLSFFHLHNILSRFLLFKFSHYFSPPSLSLSLSAL
ncbi:unnamed protein product [Acanthosepion pharaonis]|uniref:Uncharacterized protein n=1 Tax=Acanthosepion pharaonis TaxID=158019 RepID=A0A812EFZ7_ACAPH|nr:unnamed protein product [Sepia pharaonis]